MTVRDPATGRFVRAATVDPPPPSTNPRDVYGDEVLAAIYEDVRSWPEVKELDVSDPDQPRITFHAAAHKSDRNTVFLPPATYMVDYRTKEDTRMHWTEYVLGLSPWIPYRQSLYGQKNFRDFGPERYPQMKIGALCHGITHFQNQDPFTVFAQLRQWHIGMGNAYWRHAYEGEAWFADHKEETFPLIVTPSYGTGVAKMVTCTPEMRRTKQW